MAEQGVEPWIGWSRGPEMIFAGSPSCDVVLTGLESLPGPGQEIWATDRLISPGGSATRAVAAARLGARSAVVGTLGIDPFGRIVEELLAAEPRVDRRWLRADPDWQTPVSVAVTDGNDRRFLSSGCRGSAEIESSFNEAGPPQAHFVQTAVSLRQPAWIRRQRSAGAVVIGEAPTSLGHDRTADVLAGLSAVDVVLVNAEEARQYTGARHLEDAARLLVQHVPLAVITAGASGALAADGGQVVAVDGIVAAAVDPTGAGDVFAAAFMTAGLVDLDLCERLRFGCVVAGLSVERMGGAAGAPRLSDVRAWAESAAGRNAPLHAAVVRKMLDQVAACDPAEVSMSS